MVIPIKVNEDNEFDISYTDDIHSYTQQQIGTLELYFTKVVKSEELKEIDVSHIEDDVTEVDESMVSISASFLEANRKTTQDSLLCFTQSSKLLTSSFSNLLNLISLEVPKILGCEKRAVVITLVETPNSNLLGGPTKTAYFYSFKGMLLSS